MQREDVADADSDDNCTDNASFDSTVVSSSSKSAPSLSPSSATDTAYMYASPVKNRKRKQDHEKGSSPATKHILRPVDPSSSPIVAPVDDTQTPQDAISFAKKIVQKLTPDEQARVTEAFNEAHEILTLCNSNGNMDDGNKNFTADSSMDSISALTILRLRAETMKLPTIMEFPNLQDPRDQKKSLSINMWLNSYIINFFMDLLNKQEQLKGNKNYFFDDWFLSKLLEGGGYNYGNVTKWNINAERNIFKMSQVFFPHNINDTHWAIVVADFEKHSITYYDSSRGKNKRGNEVMKYLLDYLKDEDRSYYKGEYMKQEWTIRYGSCPQQTNSFDCGVFLITCSAFLSEKRQLEYSQEDMDTVRNRICHYIISSVTDTDKDVVSLINESSDDDDDDVSRLVNDRNNSSLLTAKKNLFPERSPSSASSPVLPVSTDIIGTDHLITRTVNLLCGKLRNRKGNTDVHEIIKYILANRELNKTSLKLMLAYGVNASIDANDKKDQEVPYYDYMSYFACLVVYNVVAISHATTYKHVETFSLEQEIRAGIKAGQIIDLQAALKCDDKIDMMYFSVTNMPSHYSEPALIALVEAIVQSARPRDQDNVVLNSMATRNRDNVLFHSMATSCQIQVNNITNKSRMETILKTLSRLFTYETKVLKVENIRDSDLHLYPALFAMKVLERIDVKAKEIENHELLVISLTKKEIIDAVSDNDDDDDDDDYDNGVTNRRKGPGQRNRNAHGVKSRRKGPSKRNRNAHDDDDISQASWCSSIIAELTNINDDSMASEQRLLALKQLTELDPSALSTNVAKAFVLGFMIKNRIENINNDDDSTNDDGNSNNGTITGACVHASTLEINPRVQKIYKLIQTQTGALGGNGYTGAIYGELTMHSMQRCINILIKNCEMTTSSRFIDVGSGLGKPNFHAAQYPGVRLSIGVELEPIRWQLAMTNFNKILPHMDDNLTSSTTSQPETDDDVRLYGGVNFIVGDIDNFSSTDPFTHIYMYDVGFPPPLQKRIADKFNNSVHARYLVSYRPPRRVINEYGYKVKLVEQTNTSMHGSGESHMAYFYKRTNTPAQPTATSVKITIPKRHNITGENDEEVR